MDPMELIRSVPDFVWYYWLPVFVLWAVGGVTRVFVLAGVLAYLQLRNLT